MAAHAAPLERIDAGARTFRLLHTTGRALLTALAAVLMAVGWSTRMVVNGVRLFLVATGYCVSWVLVALREGWREAAGTAGPRR